MVQFQRPERSPESRRQHGHVAGGAVVYDWLGVKEKCAQWYRDGGHDQGEKDWKALADFSDFILHGKPLPNPESFYQEPWKDLPLHFSWKAPAR